MRWWAGVFTDRESPATLTTSGAEAPAGWAGAVADSAARDGAAATVVVGAGARAGPAAGGAVAEGPGETPSPTTDTTSRFPSAFTS